MKRRGPPAGSRPIVAALALLSWACTGPRAVLHAPEAVPRGAWRVGGGLEANLSSQASRALYGGLERGVKLLAGRVSASDSAVPITADSLNDFTRALIAQSLDPLGMQPTFYLRYGLVERVDAGYRFAGGTHALDARVQFLGPAEGRDGGETGAWRGSLALQYSSQDYELPSVMGRLQDVLRFTFRRKDVLLPILFGKPIGTDGRYGSFGIGAAYNLALIEYGSGIRKLVERADSATVRPFRDLRGDRAIHSFGGFANARIGYRYVHALVSAALYSQDYGRFELFGGETANLAGWTLAPAFGLEFRF